MRLGACSGKIAESVKNQMTAKGSKVERAALISFIVSVVLVLAATWFGGSRAVTTSYAASVGGGIAFACLSAYTAYKSFQFRPPVRLIGWIFLHLTVWSIAFAGEEFGWYLWKQARLSGSEGGPLIEHFEYFVSPVLKILQGTALLGLLAVVWMIRRQANATRLRAAMMGVWATVMTASAALLILVAWLG